MSEKLGKEFIRQVCIMSDRKISETGEIEGMKGLRTSTLHKFRELKRPVQLKSTECF